MSNQGVSEAVYRILGKLDKVKQNGNGWTAICPGHPDRDPSLSVGQGGEGQVLLKCFVRCTTEEIVDALGLQMADLFVRDAPSQGGRRPKRKKGDADGATTGGDADTSEEPAGLTLAEYAAAKGLPMAFLRTLGLKDLPGFGGGAIRIPYLGVDGAEIAARFRLSLTVEPRLVWKSGSKANLYGLDRLAAARAAGQIVVVEGESDCHTLWMHDIPAIGLPGANTWKEEWATHLNGIATIIVVVEPDKGGDSVMRWLERSAIRGRARVLQMPPARKDPSSLYLADPDGFKDAWATATDGAIPWQVIETAAREASRAEAWAACASLAREPAILDRFADDLRGCGVVGEERTAKIVYLAVTSRVCDRPVSLACKGPSSAGKSWVVEQTLKFFPTAAYHSLTAMSERALAYSTEPLSHRMLVLYEAAGMSGDFASYLIRSLLSEGRLRYETVEKAHGALEARVIEREGPTGLVVTTTALHLHPENETRLLTLPATDTPAQTRNVLLALADEDRANPDLSRWHALQSWVAAGPHTVTVPFAHRLAELIPPVAVRLRRDFTAVITLIRAHALLHQASRERDADGRIVAELSDYGVVRELVADLVADGVEASVPATVRETVGAIAELLRSEGADTPSDTRATVQPHVGVADVARMLRVDKSVAWRRVQAAEFRGFVKNLEDKKGRPARLVLADALPVDLEILPTVARVQGCTRDPGDTAPPPPDEAPHCPRGCGNPAHPTRADGVCYTCLEYEAEEATDDDDV